MTLHSMAVDMASENNCKVGEEEIVGDGGGGGGNSGIGGSGEEENVNPQEHQSTTATTTTTTTTTEVGLSKPMSNNNTNNTTTAAASTNATSLPAGTKQTSSYPIEVRMIVGPHANSNYMLRPKPGQPCLIGRSKGKKFIKNGVSLYKDQEISTTHGKFIVEGGGLGGGAGATARYYFTDVGSTNGTMYEGEALMPNDKLLLESGMELKVGNSVLRVVLS